MAVKYETDGAASTEKGSLGGTNMEDIVLAYIIFGQDSSNGWTGAVMLTDSRTRPLHFAFATPVKPGTLQKLLYGGTLDEFVKVDVIAKKLIAELPRVPDVLFVESPELVAVRRVSKNPVASLTPSQTDESGNNNLSVVRFSTGEYTEDHDRVAPLIDALETSANLLDPFARMRDALKEALKAAKT
jgi:hypothetical protein